MNGWIIAGIVVLVVVAVALFAPLEARLRLAPGAGFTFRLRFLGLPIRVSGARRSTSEGRRRRRREGFGLRKGRALLAVARTPGAFGLLRRTVRRAIHAVAVPRARLVITLGLGDGLLTALVAGVVTSLRPRFEAGRGRIHFEIAPDFGSRRIEVDGDLILRTCAAPWVWLALTLLCSRTAWRARRAWRDALRD